MISVLQPPLFTQYNSTIRITEFRKNVPEYSTAMIEEYMQRPLYSMKQVHGNRALPVHKSTENWQEADAVITQDTTIAISVRWADCQNITLFDPSTNTAACIHAGWQGIVKNVIHNCVTTMIQTYHVIPSNILAVSGASLCKNCAEFGDPLTELPTVDPSFFTGRNVDLVDVARAQLVESGLRKNNIALSEECTKCDSEQYWSYRGEAIVKQNNGLRNVTVVELL